MAIDECLGIVEQQLGGHAAEVTKRPLDPVQPRRLPLVLEGADIHPARVAERGDEQMDPYGLVTDPYPALAKVDLQLPAWWRLEAYRRQDFRCEFAAQVGHRALDRAQADGDAQLGQDLLANHVGIAAMAAKPLGKPRLMPSQRPSSLRRPIWRPTTRGKVTPHGLAVAAQLGRDPPRAPAQIPQPRHRRHLVRHPHLLPPPVRHGRSKAHLIQHLVSPLLSRGGWIPDVASGWVSQVA